MSKTRSYKVACVAIDEFECPDDLAPTEVAMEWVHRFFEWAGPGFFNVDVTDEDGHTHRLVVWCANDGPPCTERTRDLADDLEPRVRH